jgi:hypothetical protein
VAEEDDTPWYRPLLSGLGALIGVAILVGALVSLVALGAVNLSGLGSGGDRPQAKPTLHIPDRTPGALEREGGDPGLTLADLNGGKDPSASAEPSATPEGSASAKPERTKPPRSVISLSASPVEVAPQEQIYLSGTYPGAEGATLQVQRFQGRWADFPTSASVSGGVFSTYVMTGQTGPNKFRVVDPATGKKSNPATVTVR